MTIGSRPNVLSNQQDAIGRRRDAAIKQGWLVKKGQRNTSSWKKRHFVLRADTLSYYKTDEANADEKASISLATCEVGPESGEDGHDWLLKVKFLFLKSTLRRHSLGQRGLIIIVCVCVCVCVGGAGERGWSPAGARGRVEGAQGRLDRGRGRSRRRPRLQKGL
jgi:hypothetical protein